MNKKIRNDLIMKNRKQQHTSTFFMRKKCKKMLLHQKIMLLRYDEDDDGKLFTNIFLKHTKMHVPLSLMRMT